MGSTLQVSCPCGFEIEELGVGGGMASSKNTCMAPAICKKCNKFLVLNLMDRSSCCPKCKGPVVFYNDPSLQDKAESDDFSVVHFNIHGKGEFILPQTKYYCPQCGKMRLKFEDVGCWD